MTFDIRESCGQRSWNELGHSTCFVDKTGWKEVWAVVKILSSPVTVIKRCDEVYLVATCFNLVSIISWRLCKDSWRLFKHISKNWTYFQFIIQSYKKYKLISSCLITSRILNKKKNNFFLHNQFHDNFFFLYLKPKICIFSKYIFFSLFSNCPHLFNLEQYSFSDIITNRSIATLHRLDSPYRVKKSRISVGTADIGRVDKCDNVCCVSYRVPSVASLMYFSPFLSSSPVRILKLDFKVKRW